MSQEQLITLITVGGGGSGGVSGSGGGGRASGSEPVAITYEGAPQFIGGEITYKDGVTIHTFERNATFEPIRRSTIATRMACKTLSILEVLNIVPKLPAIQNWWSAHKASDAARGIKSGGGGC